jgi:hypothetical protein
MNAMAAVMAITGLTSSTAPAQNSTIANTTPPAAGASVFHMKRQRSFLKRHTRPENPLEWPAIKHKQ